MTNAETPIDRARGAGGSAPRGEAPSASVPKSAPQLEPEPEPESEPERVSEPVAPKSAPEPELESASEPERVSEPVAPKSAPQPELESASEPERVSEPVAPEPELESEPEVEPERVSEPVAQSVSESASESASEQVSAPEAESQPVTDSAAATAELAGQPGGAGATDAEFASFDPRSGDVLGTYPVHDAAEMNAAVRRASMAAEWWAGLGFDGRRSRLTTWRKLLVRRLDQLAELVSAETGKPVDDARMELVLTVDHLAWAARNARRVLGPRTVRAGLLMSNQRATLAYPPFGVVGVIGPWNYPVFTPMGSIAYALAAGNAVVFKPSELTPGVGHALAETFAEALAASGDSQPVFQVVTGFGDTGAALCRSGVGKLAFTGSTATGKRVMATCAENLTPVLIECGGKDPLIVDADADLDAAADAAVWGGMSNAGQTCVGVERVYVVEPVADMFLAKVAAKAAALRPGGQAGAHFGPMTMPAQVDVVARQLRDALDKGARAVVGGTDSVRPPYVEPVVLTDVPEDSTAITEETFGPLLTVNRVPDVDEAIVRANGTAYGLGASVFSGRRGAEIAARLRCGMVAVNGVITFAGVPALPFGGVGASGFGRIHGDDGLREFTRPQAVTRQRFRALITVTSFGRSSRAMRRLVALVRAVYGH